MSLIRKFKDLLKRGNLPDDTRQVPNWLKIKNGQFADVDFSHNKVDDIIALSSDEFNEFVSSVNTDLFFVYLSTLNDSELEKFYRFNDEVVKLDENVESESSRVQFENGMENVKGWEIAYEAKARATLEVPLTINYAKNIYHRIMDFQGFVSQGYFDYEADDQFKMYEGHLVKIVWARMSSIPDHFEQVLDHFKDFYDENSAEHQAFFKHLAKRFGYLIGTIDRLVQLTQERSNTSLSWFSEKMIDQELIDPSTTLESVENSGIHQNDRLIFNYIATFASICEEEHDSYMSSLIDTVETLFEWYPINREACEYAMVEMMKSVAIKAVNVENANRFLDFFGELPRFYDVLSYDKIIELKELISHTVANHKPQDNTIFGEDGVKNKIILMNYLLDLEDLYYESGKMEK